MTLLQPVALAALIALPLILLLYILRPRHRRLVVSSVRHWERVVSDLEGRPRWRLPLVSILLIAQLLAAAALAFALARPSLPGATRQHLIILVDTSPTMLATDVSPNRLSLAIHDAIQLTSKLKPEDKATLIDIAPIPRIVASGTGPNSLTKALKGLVASPTQGDVRSALELAAQTAEQSKDTHNRIVLLSDGTFSNDALTGLGPIPADVSFQQVGGSDNNQGITALSVRPIIGASGRYAGFVQVTNFSHNDVTVGFNASADGLPIDMRRLSIPARGHVEVSLPLPVGSRLFSARLQTTDKFASDNQAEVLVPNQSRVSVTLVAGNPTEWEHALKTIPSVQLHLVMPGSYKPDNSDITIFDGFAPARLPAGSVVLAAPPAGNPIVPITGMAPTSSIVQTDENNPLFASVDIAGLVIPHPDQFGPIPWAKPISDASTGPAILEGEQAGRTIVIIGFDPLATRWPQRIAFPVFVANVVDSLSPKSFPSSISPGTALDLTPAKGADRLLITRPDGKVDVFSTNGHAVRFADTSQLGRYVVSDVKGAAVIRRDEFVTSRTSVADSNIVPRIDPQVLAKAQSPRGQPSEHEVWPWVAGGALTLLTVEWVLYFRRVSS